VTISNIFACYVFIDSHTNPLKKKKKKKDCMLG